MRKPVQIAPSLLSADFGNLEAELAQLDPQLADYLHIDVMDGNFVPNLTIGPLVIDAIHQRSNIPLDVHLMIEKPERYLKDFKASGAQLLTVHQEACRHLQACLRDIRALGMKAGASLNPSTPVEMLSQVLPDLDLILLMTVNPGFGGQEFIPQMTDKIRACKKMIGSYPIELSVDGGIKRSNIREVYEAGADLCVSGSEIFSQPSYNEAIRQLKAACQS
ncbi:MAG: ribulose-phosphate 3-epimerase [Bradymonadales bacterium]|nr:MAG: ribulose-phosphate 3-epimerase [Bradymonadales bacterium]